jgi:hypothetical protein
LPSSLADQQLQQLLLLWLLLARSHLSMVHLLLLQQLRRQPACLQERRKMPYCLRSSSGHLLHQVLLALAHLSYSLEAPALLLHAAAGLLEQALSFAATQLPCQHHQHQQELAASVLQARSGCADEDCLQEEGQGKAA